MTSSPFVDGSTAKRWPAAPAVVDAAMAPFRLGANVATGVQLALAVALLVTLWPSRLLEVEPTSS